VNGRRRFSESISEGEGISILVLVADPAEAVAAQEQGAEALVVARTAQGVREVTSLPLLARDGTPEEADGAGADAWLLVAEEHGDELEAAYRAVQALGLECIVDVQTEEELERVLEHTDPAIVLLSARAVEHAEEAVDRVLELLPDIPAGMLAAAELHGASPEDVLALERAGIDAVLLPAADLPVIAALERPAV
jgi:indole-3-glycerol phosphate synthase